MFTDKVGHHGNAVRVIEHMKLNPFGSKKVFCTEKILVFTHNDKGYSIQQLVPVHMMQGLRVLNKVRLGQSRLRPAFRMHTVSACAVGSPLCTQIVSSGDDVTRRIISAEPIGSPPSEGYLCLLRAASSPCARADSCFLLE